MLLVGRVPLEGVDEAALDELLGVVLALADDVFDRVLTIGFASYVEAEQRWRAREGLPPNPVGEAVFVIERSEQREDDDATSTDGDAR